MYAFILTPLSLSLSPPPGRLGWCCGRFPPWRSSPTRACPTSRCCASSWREACWTSPTTALTCCMYTHTRTHGHTDTDSHSHSHTLTLFLSDASRDGTSMHTFMCVLSSCSNSSAGSQWSSAQHRQQCLLKSVWVALCTVRWHIVFLRIEQI